MTRRTFEVIDIVEILQHWHAGRKKAVVASSLGVDRGTVGKYVAPAVAAGLAPGGPPLTRAEWAELAKGWFPELIDPRHRSATWPVIHAHQIESRGVVGLGDVLLDVVQVAGVSSPG